MWVHRWTLPANDVTKRSVIGHFVRGILGGTRHLVWLFLYIPTRGWGIQTLDVSVRNTKKCHLTYRSLAAFDMVKAIFFDVLYF